MRLRNMCIAPEDRTSTLQSSGDAIGSAPSSRRFHAGFLSVLGLRACVSNTTCGIALRLRRAAYLFSSMSRLRTRKTCFRKTPMLSKRFPLMHADVSAPEHRGRTHLTHIHLSVEHASPARTEREEKVGLIVQTFARRLCEAPLAGPVNFECAGRVHAPDVSFPVLHPPPSVRCSTQFVVF